MNQDIPHAEKEPQVAVNGKSPDAKEPAIEKETSSETQEGRSEIGAEMSDKQLENYVVYVSENISHQAAEIESGAKQTIESSVRGMEVSQEFVDQALSQSEINSQLENYQKQADELAEHAKAEIKTVTAETGGEKDPKQEQADRLKQLNDFRDRWLIAKRINNALETGKVTGKYKVKEKDGTSLEGEEAIKVMEAKYSELSREIVDIAATMAGQSPEEFRDKIKQDSGYDKDESKGDAYRKMLTQKATEMFNGKKDELEKLSGKKVMDPKGRQKMKEINLAQKSKTEAEPILATESERQSSPVVEEMAPSAPETEPESVAPVESQPKVEQQKQAEVKPAKPENSGESSGTQKELESYFEQRIDKSNSLMQYEDDQSRRLDAENEILSERSLLESIKNGVFPDEIRGKIKSELAIGPSEPINDEDYQQHKEEYDKSKKEYEERKARVERLVAYVDAQKAKSEANPAEQQKQPESRVEIPVPKKIKTREAEQNPQNNVVEQQQVQPESAQEQTEQLNLKKEIEDFFEQDLEKSKSSLQYSEGDRDTYELMQAYVRAGKDFLERVKSNDFFSSVYTTENNIITAYDRAKEILGQEPDKPMEGESQKYIEEYNKKMDEFKKRKARVEKMLAYMDKFRKRPERKAA